MKIALIVALLTLLGLNINMAFSAQSLMQPDWSLALLLACLLAHRLSWFWVLPLMLLHDVVLYWSPASSFVMMAVIPLAMRYFDQRIGVSLLHRLLLLLLGVLLMLFDGWPLQASLLTLCLSVPLWHLMARQYAQQAA
ncbi:MAG: hypothetical protein Q9M31_03250 [Mariprofundus sp.]|nr:hypothetical protein [Mariprofundus sp.]